MLKPKDTNNQRQCYDSERQVRILQKLHFLWRHFENLERSLEPSALTKPLQQENTPWKMAPVGSNSFPKTINTVAASRNGASIDRILTQFDIDL